MANNDVVESKAAERADWSNAFAAVSRLVAAREQALQEIEQDRPRRASPEPVNAASAAPSSEADPEQPATTLDPDQLARAIAEIEKASAVLREADPALEVWSPNSTAPGAKRKYWSIWLMIGGIWISATLVVAGATGAILYLLS